MAETATVRIDCKAGPFEVEGEIHAPWAITPATTTDREDGWRWTVTHVPTGRAVVRCQRKADARRIARALADEYGTLPWTGKDLTAIHKAVAGKFVDRVQELATDGCYVG